MTQIAVRLSDEELALLDDAVSEGLVANRTAGVRAGLDLLRHALREEKIAAAYRRAYADAPLTAEEKVLVEAGRDALAAE